jgi:hypothetical protein
MKLLVLIETQKWNFDAGRIDEWYNCKKELTYIKITFHILHYDYVHCQCEKGRIITEHSNERVYFANRGRKDRATH